MVTQCWFWKQKNIHHALNLYQIMVNSTSETRLINTTTPFNRICNLNPNTRYCVSVKVLAELGSNTTIPGTNFSDETCAKTGRKRVKKYVTVSFHNCCQTCCDSALYDDLNAFYVCFMCFSVQNSSWYLSSWFWKRWRSTTVCWIQLQPISGKSRRGIANCSAPK